MDQVFFRRELLTDFFQLRHPRLEQVAVLEHDPVAFFLAFVDEGLGHFFLTLPQAFVLQPLIKVHLVGKGQHLLSGISSLAQNKDDRSDFVRV
mmetsp:Transcript_7543/g.6896  ORF Transcript_7543/g.6896 Transcript_7543/m.6896 type:complete len:93 (+) Transcript_7543:1725-2003(+)